MKVLDLSYHPLDCRSGGWVDLSRKGNHGTPYGGARPYMIAPGVMGFEFDGVDDYVDCGNDESLQVETGDFTVETWFYMREWKCGMEIIDKAKNIICGYVLFGGWSLSQNYGKTIFAISDSVAGQYASVKENTVRINQWVHAVGVRNSNNIYLYVNGNLIGTADATGINIDTNLTLRIGGHTIVWLSNGLIAKPCIYNRALSADEIRENMYRSPIYRMLRGLPHSMIYTKVPWKRTQGGIYIA